MSAVLLENSNGLTIRELYEWLELYVTLGNGDKEVWFESGPGLSSVATTIDYLNDGDILIYHDSD